MDKIYEYKILKSHYCIDKQQEDINNLALKKWELINVLHKTESGTDYTYYYFKREKI